MENRIVRLENGYWQIRSDKGDLAPSEHRELKLYFDEIRFPYHMIGTCTCVPESITWGEISERLNHFYDGRADVLPF